MRTVPCIGNIGIIDEVIIKQCNFCKIFEGASKFDFLGFYFAT